MVIPLSIPFLEVKREKKGRGAVNIVRQIQDANVSVVANSSSEIIQRSEDIREELYYDLISQVRWVQSIKKLEQTVKPIQYIILGGDIRNVISRLVKEIIPDSSERVFVVNNADSLEETVARLAKQSL